MLILFLFGIILGQAASLKVSMKTHWSGGVTGSFCIPITQDLHGWKAHLIFDHVINKLDVSTCIAEKKQGGKEFVLTNKPFNKEEHVGDKLCVDFVGHTDSDINPTATVSIEGMDGSGSSFSHTTALYFTMEFFSPGGDRGLYDYSKPLANSILFYNAQRSGKLPANNPIKWRGDSALKDGSDVGVDLTGGWYDAGDHVKFGLPMAATAHLLLWSYIQWPDAYSSTSLTDKFFDMIKWPLDYFLKCWIPSKNEFYMQVGNGDDDHHFWGRAEDMKMARPSLKNTASKPGSDVAGETAAAMAAGSIAFKKRDHAYSTKLLTAAKSLYVFAKTYTGKYSQSVQGAGQFYSSSGYTDELCEAAIWLYRATKDQKYLNDAKGFVETAWAWALSWDDKKVACQLMLYQETQDDMAGKAVIGFMKSWLPGGGITYTPCGLAWRDQWGSTRYAANTAFLALMAADAGLEATKYRKWAQSQINYILGQNKQCFSYVIGFGKKFPRNPHHRSASCPMIPAPCSEANLHSSGPSPHILVGALVGGPDAKGAYTDKREDYVHNEVACDYNSGFHSALAGLIHLTHTKSLPRADTPKCPCSVH
ncbi:hypothetical protein LOTGIDRAFT_105466 [Lottia gigantea]|uniref:Endoglucanase n=1 Tax=Lottia gigantea TaxID=225164 RepID=V4A8S7_LOTGI|nr:hypothetical protein LOTGIDRAFT_105466 [Lottia gigantea]ESO91445.1 hypothetical protein LOTGIDRAFT_105466 [Lottia gigantea]